ncbi:GTPase-activating protein S23, partial [Conglomerata obtusa]
EYVLSKDASYPPIFVLLIDVGTFDDERHLLLQDAVKTTLENLPQDCLVSIIHFDANIELFVNTHNEIKRSYLFSDKKEYTVEMLKGFLNKSNEKGKVVNTNARFFYPLSELNFNPYEIKKDPFP